MKLLLLAVTIAITMPITGSFAQTSIYPRLIAYAHTTYDGSDYTPTDSGCLRYSNGRTFNAKTNTFQFDTNRIFVYLIPYSEYGYRIKEFETYDHKNNLLIDRTQRLRLSDSSWQDSLQFLYTYDSSSNMLSKTQQRHALDWVNVDRYLYSFDAASNALTVLYQIWSTNGWQNNYNHAFTYDTYNNRTNDIYQTYDTTRFIWVNIANGDYTFNTSNKVVTEKVQKWIGSSWLDSARYQFGYDMTNTYLESKLRDVNISATWVYDTNVVYTYDTNHNMVSELHQYYWGYPTLWMDSSLYTYTYDANHNRISALKQNNTTRSVPTAYQNEWYEEYSYNNYHQMTSYKSTEWNVIGGFWEPTTADHFHRYYYAIATGVSNTTKQEGDLKIYPSPANDILDIALTWDKEENSLIMIYDMSGRLWSQWQTGAKQAYHYQYPVVQLPSGIYIISIRNANNEISKIFSVAH